jgi:glycine cleavage system aminomethyltransferase T
MIADRLRPYKLSSVYQVHCALNARWTECCGWRVPAGFGEPEAEASQVRRSVGLEDVSSLGKLDIKGTSVEAVRRAAERLDHVLAVLPLKPGHALLLTTPGQEEQTIDALGRVFDRGPGCLHVTETTSGQAAFALVGPQSGTVLSGLTSLDVRPEHFRDHACAQTSLAHVRATIYRGDWGTLRAYLLLVSRDVGEFVWTVVQTEGHACGLTPFGVDAERLLRGAVVSARPRALAPGDTLTVTSQAS